MKQYAVVVAIIVCVEAKTYRKAKKRMRNDIKAGGWSCLDACEWVPGERVARRLRKAWRERIR